MMMLDDGQHTVPMLTMGTRDLAIFRNRIAKISNQITNCVYVMIVDFHTPAKKGPNKIRTKGHLYSRENVFNCNYTYYFVVYYRNQNRSAKSTIKSANLSKKKSAILRKRSAIMRIYIKNILKNLDYDLIWAYFGNKNINKEKLIENVKRRITTKKRMNYRI